MSCAEGYSFEGDLASETEVTLQCGSGGVWNVTSASCAREFSVLLLCYVDVVIRMF